MANDAPTTDSAAVDYQELLEIEQSHLRAQLAELGFGDSGSLIYDPNFADSSQVTAERGEAEVLAGELQEALDAVEAAIARMAAGTFGRCENCGEEITPARLEAKPAARLCITCASRQ
jgi:DnaK suppressor protein